MIATRPAGSLGRATALLLAAVVVLTALVAAQDPTAAGPIELTAPSARPHPDSPGAERIAPVSMARHHPRATFAAVIDDEQPAAAVDLDPHLPVPFLRRFGPDAESGRRHEVDALRSLAANRAASSPPSDLLRWRPQRLDGP